jgi:hypothetical protein
VSKSEKKVTCLIKRKEKSKKFQIDRRKFGKRKKKKVERRPARKCRHVSILVYYSVTRPSDLRLQGRSSSHASLSLKKKKIPKSMIHIKSLLIKHKKKESPKKPLKTRWHPKAQELRNRARRESKNPKKK